MLLSPKVTTKKIIQTCIVKKPLKEFKCYSRKYSINAKEGSKEGTKYVSYVGGKKQNVRHKSNHINRNTKYEWTVQLLKRQRLSDWRRNKIQLYSVNYMVRFYVYLARS